MKLHLVASFLVIELLAQYVSAQSIRSIFLFKDVMKSNTTALKTSGFNTLIMFGIGILENGDIKYYSNTPGSEDVVVASGGEYIGGDSLAEKVRSFKEGNTGVDRLEICMNSHHVETLMANPGPSPDTVLYRNFAALKEAWSLDAVNNNDESIYDMASTVTFGRMLGEVGYKYTLAPYTNAGFWLSLISQLNTDSDQLIDRVYLQCYDGGAYNDPVAWQDALGVGVVPLIWVINDSKPQFGTTAEQARGRLQGWHDRTPLAGGGYWNDYDIEKMGLSYEEYGNVLTSVFP